MYSKVEDFLKDDDFIKFVLDAAPETASRWSKFLGEHAELLEVFEEAKKVLLASEEVITSLEKCELKQRIFITLKIEESY